MSKRFSLGGCDGWVLITLRYYHSFRFKHFGLMLEVENYHLLLVALRVHGLC